MFVFESLRILIRRTCEFCFARWKATCFWWHLKELTTTYGEIPQQHVQACGQMLKGTWNRRARSGVGVEAAQREVLSTARRLAEAGELMLGGGADDFL